MEMSNKEQLIEILTQRYKRYDGIYRRNVSDSEENINIIFLMK